jgi:hypothetical protein
MSAASILPALIERFFTQRLMQQRNASPHTIASYRDTFRLLLSFAQTRLGKPPSRLDLADLDAPFIGAFLDDLEAMRGDNQGENSATIRVRMRRWGAGRREGVARP